MQDCLLGQPDITCLCRLTALQSIDISNSSFSGSLPATFNSTSSPNLRSFTAFGNNLTGPLPASLPANLTTLGLGQNQLNGTLPAYNSSVLSTLQVSAIQGECGNFTHDSSRMG